MVSPGETLYGGAGGGATDGGVDEAVVVGTPKQDTPCVGERLVMINLPGVFSEKVPAVYTLQLISPAQWKVTRGAVVVLSQEQAEKEQINIYAAGQDLVNLTGTFKKAMINGKQLWFKTEVIRTGALFMRRAIFRTRFIEFDSEAAFSSGPVNCSALADGTTEKILRACALLGAGGSSSLEQDLWGLVLAQYRATHSTREHKEHPVMNFFHVFPMR